MVEAAGIELFTAIENIQLNDYATVSYVMYCTDFTYIGTFWHVESLWWSRALLIPALGEPCNPAGATC